MANSGDSAASRPPDTDAVLPSQFWTHPGQGAQPERRLMAAVLEDAVALCARVHRGCDPEALGEAEAALSWMASDDRAGAFSFAGICDVLGLEPNSVREAIADIRRSNSDFVRPRVSAGRGRHQIRQKRPRSRAA